MIEASKTKTYIITLKSILLKTQLECSLAGIHTGWPQISGLWQNAAKT